jgi:hypothetical protein
MICNGGAVQLRNREESLKVELDGREYLNVVVDFMVKLLRACVWMPWRK